MATKIKEKNLDVSVITGNTELSAKRADDDVILVFDTSGSNLKKIQASNFAVMNPTVTSVSPTNVNSGDGTGNHTFTITGTQFASGATASLINTSGSTVAFDSVTRNSATQITGVIAKSSLPNSGEPYDVRVTSNGISSDLLNQINVNAQPVFTTASGTLHTGNEGTSVNVTVNATDPESAGNVTFELQSGSLGGLTLANEGTEGGTARISGTLPQVNTTTTFNFVLRAVDAASNTSSRSFAIVSTHVPVRTSFTSSGTFAVPAGITAIDVLAVGGGGGSQQPGGPGGSGAGGLIFMPGYPVQTGTLAVTVGDGGVWPGGEGQNSTVGASPSPAATPTGGTLTAYGGGSGRHGTATGGGSGGGGGTGNCNGGAGPGQQSTYSGNSGAYGFGNNGGTGNPFSAGGGGGAGSGGVPGHGNANGGDGKAYSIADGTTSVYYAGGGGAYRPSNTPPGGQGGGGQGSGPGSGTSGSANTGGGGGGPDGDGGKGIVIIAY